MQLADDASTILDGSEGSLLETISSLHRFSEINYNNLQQIGRLQNTVMIYLFLIAI